MFKFVIAVVLIGFLILGGEFVQAYKFNNMTEAEKAQLVEEQKAEAALERKEVAAKKAYIDKTLSPVSELESTSDKVTWWITWSVIALTLIGIYFVAFSIRNKALRS